MTYIQEPTVDEYFFLCAGVDFVDGFICFGRTPLAEGVFDVYWIAVRPGARKKGVAKALLEEAEKIMRSEGARMVICETSSGGSYHEARCFYTRSGFKHVATVPDFYSPGDHKMIYAKSLSGED